MCIRDRDEEVRRAEAPGRHKEAHTHMKRYVAAFGSVLTARFPEVPAQNAPGRPSLPLSTAANFQRAAAAEARAENKTRGAEEQELDLQQLLDLMRRNQEKDDEVCVAVPLEDALLGPGHVARKLIQKAAEDPQGKVVFNEEQILVIALMVWPVEQAWRTRIQGKQDAGVTVGTLRKLPSDLGLPRVGVIGGGGCGKTTILQRVVVPVLELFFEKVIMSAPSNRAARGFDPRAKTMHSLAGLKPQDSCLLYTSPSPRDRG